MGFLASKRAERSAETEFDAFEVVAAQVVDVIATAGVVLDQQNQVVRASPGAVQFGLVQNRRLIHAALVQLAEDAKKASGAVSVDIELETGLRRDTVWVHARAAKFGERYVMLLVDDRTDSRKLDEFLNDVCKALRFALQRLRELLNGLRVVSCSRDGLGEKAYRTDWSLQLVRDVCDKVAPGLLELPRVGAVVNQEHDVALSKLCGSGVDPNGVPSKAGFKLDIN